MVDHLLGRHLRAGQGVTAILMELGGGHVEGEGDLAAGVVAGGLDGLEDHVENGPVVREVGGEAAFVANVRRQPLTGKHSLEGVVDLDTGAEGFSV